MSDKTPNSKRFPIPIVAVLIGVLGVLTIAISIFAMAFGESDPTSVLYRALSIYILILAVSFAIYFVHKRMRTGDFTEIKGSLFGTISLNFIQDLYMPVLICDDKGKIVWYNGSLSSAFHAKGVLYGKYLDSICNATIFNSF